MSLIGHNVREGRRLFNPATRKLFEYALVGLAIGAALIAGLQIRPQTLFPSGGTLQIELTSGVPVAELSTQASISNCHGGSCNATSVNVTVTSIEVHTYGFDNMTGGWTLVCGKQLPMTVDLTQVATSTKSLCGTTLQPDTITNVRLSVSAVLADFPDQGATTCGVPSGKLEIPLSPLAQIQAGKTTTVIIELQPHLAVQGNGDCKLTPALHAMTASESKNHQST
jgi:hypothetical protein